MDVLTVCLPSGASVPIGQGCLRLARGCVSSTKSAQAISLDKRISNARTHAVCLSARCMGVKRPSLVSKTPPSPQRENVLTTRFLSTGDKRKCIARLGLYWGFAKNWYRKLPNLKRTLSSFKSHLHSTQIDCKPAPGLPPSVCEQWERGLHPKRIYLTLNSGICYLLGTQIRYLFPDW